MVKNSMGKSTFRFLESEKYFYPYYFSVFIHRIWLFAIKGLFSDSENYFWKRDFYANRIDEIRDSIKKNIIY